MKTHKFILEKIPLALEIEDILLYFAKIKNTVILESSLVSETLGHYTIIGIHPFLTFKAKGNTSIISSASYTETFQGNSLETLRQILLRYKTDWNSCELPFIGGVMGYFSYDLVNFIEKVPNIKKDDMEIYDIELGFYNQTLIIDHHEQMVFCIGTSSGATDEWEEEAFARYNLEKIKKLLSEVNPCPIESKTKDPSIKKEILSNFSKDEYLNIVNTAKEYIRNGDIFQVNLSQRFEMETTQEPLEIYKRLRKKSPAPFSAYLLFDWGGIISSSPERFFKITGREIESRPIKGTRPRSQDPFQDEWMKEELLRSPKDAAELTMIVDLVRNDLGRVCRIGSVKVKEHRIIEAYSNVYHTVSTVVGELKEGKDFIDCLYAAFPGGSITGAPKIRAMEIIEELESNKRNLYTGSIGFVDFNGNADMNIVIRTIVLKHQKAYYSVGGGIVWDSEPETEYEETLHKGKMMLEVLKEA